MGRQAFLEHLREHWCSALGARPLADDAAWHASFTLVQINITFMDLSGGRESNNVDDLRGSGGGRRLMVGGGLGTLAVALIALLLGKNPSSVLNSINGGGQPTQTQQQTAPGQEDEGKRFVRIILGETEDVWTGIFQQQLGREYVKPRLTLFTDQVESECGTASSQVGPFYCPLDSRVYLDLSFFDELSRRFGASGDFANAYVIAHEVGHHVQNLLGISDKVHQLQARTSERGGNQLSVKLELQADFFAGVWARNSQRLKIDEQDIAEALNAASAIGDDKLQMQAQGYVVPDAFTHGTSEQRMYWFKKGWQTGDINQGDTFGDAMASLQ
jgi:predicted metalloprotease